MQPKDYTERIVEVEGWQVRVKSYELDGVFHCSADNVSPGANLTRTSGATREEAESAALDKAKRMLGRTKRHAT
jgi:hypothetical protein